MGRDGDALSALKAAARKPRLDLYVTRIHRLSAEAAREAELPFPEAGQPRGGASSGVLQIRIVAMLIEALATGEAEQGRGKETVEYCLLGSELGDLIRRTGRSLTEAIAGIVFVSRSARPVAEALPIKEAQNREPLPGANRFPAGPGSRWYKGRFYDVVREEAGQPALNELLNRLYAASSMADVFSTYRRSRNSSAEGERYSRDGILSWYLMVAGAGLLALAAALFALFLLVRFFWVALRRPQGGMSAGWQTALLTFNFAVSGAIAAILAARVDVIALAPVLSRTVWVFPIVLIVVLGVAARVQTRRLLSPERGINRCLVGMLHQVLPNALLAVVLSYLALAVPTAVMRHQMTSTGLAYMVGDKRAHFREEMGWDEAKVRYPFPIGESSRSINR